MDGDRKLNRETIAEAFSIMGEVLARDRVTGEIHVYGGTSIMLQFEARETTQDVDCVVTSGHGSVIKGMLAVRRKLGLPSSWLNEAVSIYVSRAETESDFFPFGVYPSYSRPFLKVMVARPEYILAMKIQALQRGEERDVRDVSLLASHLGIDDIDGLKAVRNQYFGNKPIQRETERILHSIRPPDGRSEDAPHKAR